MLQTMRGLAKSWVFKTLMGLLVVSFSIWGIGDMFRGNPLQRTVANAGDVSISVQALEAEFQHSVREAQKNFGPDLTVEQARRMGLLERTLNMLIEKALFDQNIKKLGIEVGEQTLLDQIAAMPQFRNEDGSFNRAMWAGILRQNNMSERDFLKMQQQEEERRLLFSSLTGNAVPSKLLVDHLYQARGQKRVAEVITVPNAVQNLKADPKEEELKAYYDAHTESFMAPEYRAITTAKLSASESAKDVIVSDDDLKKAYETRRDELFQPELRDISQIILQDEGKAKEIAKAAQASGDLAKSAKAAGYNAISIDKVDEKNSSLPELYKRVFALKEREISVPIHTDMGWHIVAIKKVYPAQHPSFEQAKAQLRLSLVREQAADVLTRNVNRWDDALAAGRSLEETSDDMKLRLIKIASVDAKGQTPEGKEPSEFPGREDVLKTAFAQSSGETSSILELKGAELSDYIAVRTDDISPAHVKPFEIVRPLVLAAWKADAQAKAARDEAEKIASALRSGAQAASFDGKNGANLRLSAPISLLGDRDAKLPSMAIGQILSAKLGDVFVVSDDQNQFVLRLAEIRPAGANSDDGLRQKQSSSIERQIEMDLIEQYAHNLHKLYRVHVFSNALDGMKKEEN